MARKTRSPRDIAPIRTELDLPGLYEELSPPWKDGSVDPMPPADWDPAVFGARKRPHGHKPKNDPGRAK